jgi:hypothetical protein
MKLPEVTWKRHEYLHLPQRRKANLLWLAFDIPYFDACGIFPPFHIANQIFLSGGGDGGMSPGASWKPFSISEEEYTALVDAVMSAMPSAIARHARYAWIPKAIDHSFDQIQDRWKWFTAVCEKHRDSFHQKLKKLGQIE